MSAATIPPPPIECPNVECFTSFDLVTASGSGISRSFTQPGAVSAPFAGFERSPPVKLDTKSIEGVGFTPATSGDYTFCISDFKLFDAAGNEVTP